jgi:hypothetical protein
LLPKEGAMAQLSRPYQIALAVLAFLVLVWFVALRGHSSSSTPVASTPASTPVSTPASAPESTAASEAKAAAAPTPVYHGATPGVTGLTRAINKAHGAVATSQQDAKRFEHASAQAPGQSAEGTAASTATTGSQPAAAPVTPTKQAATPAATPATTTKQAAVSAGRATKTSKSAAHVAVKPHTVTKGIPAQQAAVESELKQGKVVALLFWNPKGADDMAVRKELQAVGKQLGGKLAVHIAQANQVGAFGSITQAIQVYQTPTILFVNGKGLTTTLTGFTDAFSIEQTINEARKA